MASTPLWGLADTCRPPQAVIPAFRSFDVQRSCPLGPWNMLFPPGCNTLQNLPTSLLVANACSSISAEPFLPQGGHSFQDKLTATAGLSKTCWSTLFSTLPGCCKVLQRLYQGYNYMRSLITRCVHFMYSLIHLICFSTVSPKAEKELAHSRPLLNSHWMSE